MTLTQQKIDYAFNKIVDEILKDGAMPYTKQELKQAVTDAEAWAENPTVKSDFNSNLTAGNFKTNASSDQKRLVLIFALYSIIKG